MCAFTKSPDPPWTAPAVTLCTTPQPQGRLLLLLSLPILNEYLSISPTKQVYLLCSHIVIEEQTHQNLNAQLGISTILAPAPTTST
eukprot:13642508-Ditylum_brightwellii.AAC.1